MATEIKPLVFDDGANVEIRIGGSTTVIAATALDFQESGIMYEYDDNGVSKRVFRPWSTALSVTQNL